jgi:glutamine amidotransferase
MALLWTLAHKGTVFDYSPLNPYFAVQTGTTDSERILLYLVDWINAATEDKGAPLEADERFAVFSRLVAVVSPGNCLNLLVYDSDRLLIYSNYQGGLNVLSAPDCALFCTSELAAAYDLPEFRSGQAPQPPHIWQPLRLCVPLSYRHGELIFSGERCGEQYFAKDEDTRYLYQDYAAL